MRRIHLVLGVVAGLSIGGSFASSAYAQADADRAAARQLGEAGQAALDAKDYKTAEDKFRRADTLVHAPTLLLGLARALAGEGKLLEAQEAYKRIVREGVAPGSPPVFQKALEDARQEVDTVSPRIGNVTISIKTAGGEASPPNMQVALDGAPVNAALLGVKRPANPGSHQLHVTADGYKPVDLKVDVPEGGAVDAPVTLEKDPNAVLTPAVAPPPADGAGATPATGASPEQPSAAGGGPGIWPWVAFGVGAAGLITGGVTGAMAMGVHSDLSSACNSAGVCHSDQQSKVDNYNTLGTISTVGFIVGGVGAAAGALLLVLHPNLTSGSAAPASTGLHVYPVLGLGAAGAAGTF
ncbi:MAG TPA: hypothetical protein VMI75_34255 [Polyangiaceae bacterium]|nr:hypothetical protein [Polyangiaceae bacterium]